MHALHIALQEGFAHDDVVVSVDDAPVYQAQDISTRQQIGLAASYDAQVSAGEHRIALRMPKRGIESVQALSVSSDTWLGVNVRGNRLELRTSATPFGYL